MRNALKSTPVLVLNSSYEPLNYASAKRALGMVYKGVASVEESHDIPVNVRFAHKLPCVVRLTEYHRPFQKRLKLSRNHIYIRDCFTCQYCGGSFSEDDLTLDHVIPRSKGGLATWENLVASCRPCNQKKADRHLRDCPEMKLLRVPRPMTIHTSRHMLRNMGAGNAKWRKYLYY
jgi:5-methylcytosine-specific restriction endonuclease McrA